MKIENLKLTIVLLLLFGFTHAQKNDILDKLCHKVKFLNSKSLVLEKNSHLVLDSICNIIKKDSLNYIVESHSATLQNAIERTKKRAELLRKELIKRGIKKSRLNSIGHGANKRKFICTTRVCNMQNERIEIKRID
ncbi:OmpA family protein [Tenacibaculum sp. 190524A05c]|uniref:OmpA family protein n=1 Tax=Tenacibaculum platacis TaxID=3137852 RepID=UPI0031FAA0D9